MKAYLVSYLKEIIMDVREVEISDDYDGDCYGDKVPFTVSSNQSIVTRDNPLWNRCNKIYNNLVDRIVWQQMFSNSRGLV